MPKNELEKKLNKHKKKKQKCMCAACGDNLESIMLQIPIDQDPPFKKSSIPNLFNGDLVFWKKEVSDIPFGLPFYSLEESKKAGIVISSHWMKTETSTKFSKKEGGWISNFICIPHAVVLWNDGEMTSIPMDLLERESGE